MTTLWQLHIHHGTRQTIFPGQQFFLGSNLSTIFIISQPPLPHPPSHSLTNQKEERNFKEKMKTYGGRAEGKRVK